MLSYLLPAEIQNLGTNIHADITVRFKIIDDWDSRSQRSATNLKNGRCGLESERSKLCDLKPAMFGQHSPEAHVIFRSVNISLVEKILDTKDIVEVRLGLALPEF